MTQKTSAKTKRQIARREEKLEEGTCIACDEPAVTKRHCEYHRVQHNANSGLRAKRKRGSA